MIAHQLRVIALIQFLMIKSVTLMMVWIQISMTDSCINNDLMEQLSQQIN